MLFFVGACSVFLNNEQEIKIHQANLCDQVNHASKSYFLRELFLLIGIHSLFFTFD